MIRHLESACLQEHGTIEEYIQTDGNELLRLIYQGYLDKQANDEEKAASVTASDGVSRNHVRQNTSRTLTTVFGKVMVTRMSYSQRKACSEFPLDAALNLHGDQYSDGIRKRIVTDAIDSALMIASSNAIVRTVPALSVNARQSISLKTQLRTLLSSMSIERQKMSKPMT